MVFKSIRGSPFDTASTWAFSMSACHVIQDHPVYIPRRDARAPCRGWPASGPGRLRPGPWFLTGVSAVVSRVKRDFAYTSARAFPPGLVVLRGTVALDAGGADTYTQRAIPGSGANQIELVELRL